MNQLCQWGFQEKDRKIVGRVLAEWFAGNTLESTLKQWESRCHKESQSEQIQLSILCYNVQGWGARCLEVVDMVYRVETSICVFTEVGELWNTSKVPHFNTFHQHGTNKSGGVCIAVGKHLKAGRIKCDIENTLVIDVSGLSESVRVIAIYWPAVQVRDLEALESFLVENTVITGDFNASVKEWGSESSDKRGRRLKEWIEKNSLHYVESTSHSSKRSSRNIDLTFTNIGGTKAETLNIGSSDHWPIEITCENIFFDKSRMFPHVHWNVFEAILTLVQEFWIKEQNSGMRMDEWYVSYVRFLSALKNRLTEWKEKEKFRPSLPAYIIQKLKEVKRIRNRYYRTRSNGDAGDGTRVLLRTMSRELKIEIAKYKSAKWQEFLSKVQTTHDNVENAFWLHLSRIYKSKSVPFSKLDTGKTILRKEEQMSDELFRYYAEPFKAPTPDMSDLHEVQIEIEYIELTNRLAILNDEAELTNITEIKRFISKMKPKKSAGFDEVSNFMIKRLPLSYVQCLANCFNTWLREYRYPEEWKLAKIVTLNKLKSGIPRCDQTRPISLLATHSKLFEKILLERVRYWAETNSLVPIEQSGFRPGCLLPTRVLSIYQEVKNKMAANIPTLAVYVDYQKAYDKVWHKGLVVKLYRLGIPLGLLKLIVSWLSGRRAYVSFGASTSNTFQTYIGLPQGSSLSPYLFIVYHCDLIACAGAHSSHIFADDLNILISPPVGRELKPMIKFLEEEGSRVCNSIANYSKKWKQPINVAKTVAQVFHTQVRTPTVNVYMQGQQLEIVKEFRYLGFTWTNKMSMKPTVDRALENIQRTFSKLRWMKSGTAVSTKVLRRCFFAYSFPHFAWIFPMYPFLPKSQKELIVRKFRNGLRLVHRCPFARTTDLFRITKEKPLEFYVKRYIGKRLKQIEKSDLGRSLFYTDLFYWEKFEKKKNDHLGQFFRMKRVKNMRTRHRSLLLE